MVWHIAMDQSIVLMDGQTEGLSNWLTNQWTPINEFPCKWWMQSDYAKAQ